MNVLTIFDQRITAIFEEGAPGVRPPFSFKRLAKRAVREMEDETFVIDGVDTAPALYTVLVSQANDAVMRPLYPQITNEISQLIEAQAKKRGYTFVGRPLVRFMVDPAMRGGRCSVFAENIDPRTLARLRDEENVYLGITPPHEVYVEQSFIPSPIPVHEEEPMPVAQEVSFVQGDSRGFAPVPDQEPESAPELEPEPLNGLDQPEAPQPEDDLLEADSSQPLYPDLEEEPNASNDELDPFQVVPESYVAEASLEAAQEAQAALHAKSEPEPEPEAEFSVQRAAHAAPSKPACSLMDLGSSRTYRVTTKTAIIGREQIAGGVVLSDPNASRRHAELVFDGSVWAVRDLNSTNGTLVNDVDVPEAVLHDGDILTIGLTNLEFRAG